MRAAKLLTCALSCGKAEREPAPYCSSGAVRRSRERASEAEHLNQRLRRFMRIRPSAFMRPHVHMLACSLTKHGSKNGNEIRKPIADRTASLPVFRSYRFTALRLLNNAKLCLQLA